MNIKSVRLVFENCEVLDIDVEDILFLHTNKEQVKYNRYSGSLRQMTVLKEFGIALKKDIPCEFWSHQTVQERLSLRDVTWVTLNFTNDTNKEYYLEWNEWDTDQFSTAQRLQFTPDGHIIYISSTASMVQVDPEKIDSIAENMARIAAYEKRIDEGFAEDFDGED